MKISVEEALKALHAHEGKTLFELTWYLVIGS